MEEIIIQNNYSNNKSIEELIDLTLLTKFEFDIAVLFHRMCKDKYKTTIKQSKSDKNITTWHIFQNEKWEKNQEKKYLKIIQKLHGSEEKLMGHLKKVKNTLIQNKLQLMVFFMIQFL